MEKNEKKNFMKNKIVKYAGCGLLALGVLGAGIGIADATVDHTTDVCFLTQMGQCIELDKETDYTLGDSHQMSATKDDFKNQGIDVDMVYKQDHFYDVAFSKARVPLLHVTYPDGSGYHKVPEIANYVEGSGKDTKAYIVREHICNVVPGYVAYSDIYGEYEEINAVKKLK